MRTGEKGIEREISISGIADKMITFHTKINKIHYPHIALDLGYSHKAASCGIMHSGIKEPVTLHFGNTINEVSRLVDQIGTCVLIIEAVLSTYHDENGNPEIRLVSYSN